MQLDLPEIEKARIRLEESYRHGIRSEFERQEKDQNRPGKVWQFLNSAFGLWLLSAVVLTGLSSLYATYSEYWAEMKINGQRVARLDTEISYRLSRILSALNRSNEKKENVFVGYLDSLVQTKPSQDPAKQFAISLYKEHEDLSLVALMAELERMIPDVRESRGYCCRNRTSCRP